MFSQLSLSAEQLSVESVFGSDYAENLGCGQYFHEALMIFLLQLLHLDVIVVAQRYSFGACLVVVRVHMAQASVLPEEGKLLLTHLSVYGEEGGSFFRGQPSLGGDELLQIGLELCRVEMMVFLSRHFGHAE